MLCHIELPIAVRKNSSYAVRSFISRVFILYFGKTVHLKKWFEWPSFIIRNKWKYVNKTHEKKTHTHTLEHLEKCKRKSWKRGVCRRPKEIMPPKCVAFNKALFWERVIQPQSTTIKIVPAKVKCLVGRLVGLHFGWYCSTYASLIHSICVSIKPLHATVLRFAMLCSNYDHYIHTDLSK